MRRPGTPRLLATTTVAALSVAALSGCSFLEPVPASSPLTSVSPTPSPVDTSKYIGGLIDPDGTVWSGKDSGGDLTTLTLHAGGTVAVSYGDNAYDDPNDVWKVTDGILYLTVHIDEANGDAHYVATWDPEKSVLNAVLRTTRTALELTVTLTQK